jgi:hypothetical protein
VKTKFEIYYCEHHPDKEKAGTRYKPRSHDMLVMNSSGVFFLYSGEQFYPSIAKLVDKIGNYDVKWK